MSDADALLLGAAGDGLELVRLSGVRSIGRHGVYPFERRDGQPFVVDVTLRLQRASRDDDVTTTVHYGELAAAIAADIAGEPVDLIETLAGRLADLCLAHPVVAGVVVTVHKPEAPVETPLADVAVTVVRTRGWNFLDPERTSEARMTPRFPLARPESSTTGSTPSVRAFAVSLGSNLGDSAAILVDAIQRLDATDGVRLTAVSSPYRTAPVGGVEQDDFLNAVAVGETTLTASGLLAACQAIEAAHGRTREVRWGPRTLDIDVLTFGDAISDAPELTLPHPRAQERAFVLVPWLEADADAHLPGRGPVAGLLERVGREGVRPADDVDWPFPEPGERR